MAITTKPETTRTTPWYQRRIARLHGEGLGPDGVDIGIAAACFVAFTVPELFSGTTGHGSLPAMALFGAAAVLPLLVRRRWPVAAVVAVTVVLGLATIAGVRFTPWVSNTGPALGVAILTLANQRSRRDSLLVTGAALIALYVCGLLGTPLHPNQDQDFVQLPIAAVGWLAGDMLRTRRDYRESLAAQQLRRAAAEEQRIRAEERLRVSRDVHDLISHTLSMVAVRSGVARLLIDEQPGEAREALSTIETASRSALRELRQVLAQIREPGQPDESDEPGLAEIDALVAGLRHDGLSVEYRVVGAPADYPALLQTTAYRIVQEALTNVVKHANTDRAQVEIRHAAHELTVFIADDGPVRHHDGPESSGSGLGLVGMRERASLFGGRLDAGPRPEGGFAVTAYFPLDEDHHD
ncbi:sensor histidine kinase [Nocardia altamirensis]|uniref:sensor histidine kinase n=1 Tax=Nocardia altamirensis TaxID=472158 RepID=UPI00083FFDDB|nr:sensor histidine kinase [Nocardia altamirensis]